MNAIEINSFIMDGQLQLEFNYSTKEFKEETIKTLTESYINRLIDIIQHCEMKKFLKKHPLTMEIWIYPLEIWSRFYQAEKR